VSDCVGRGASALLCPGAYNAVKTAMDGPDKEVQQEGDI